MLSFEIGACKPELAIFRDRSRRLGARPDEMLMSGDRDAQDGGAVQVGVATLLVPPLTDKDERRLDLVLGPCAVSL